MAAIPAAGSLSVFRRRMASTVSRVTCRLRITDPFVLSCSFFMALSRLRDSTGSSVSRKSASSFTRRGSAQTM